MGMPVDRISVSSLSAANVENTEDMFIGANSMEEKNKPLFK